MKKELLLFMIAVITVMSMIYIANENSIEKEDYAGQAKAAVLTKGEPTYKVELSTVPFDDKKTYEPAEIPEGIINTDINIANKGTNTQTIRLAVIMVNYLDSPPIPFNKTGAHELIFNRGLKKFIEENSYGQYKIEGDVFGWYQINRNNNGNCYASTASSHPELSLLSQIPDLGSYEYVTFLLNDNECDMIYALGIGKREYVINEQTYQLGIQMLYSIQEIYNIQWEYHTFPYTQLEQSIAHELEHSMGLGHSNALECGIGQSIGIIGNLGGYKQCQVREYGNKYDTMGNARFSIHNAVFQKEKLGILKPEDIIIINQTGNYTINNLENDRGKRGAKIVLSELPETLYYLEYRTPILLDQTLGNPPFNNNKGLFIYKNIAPILNYQYLLDMSPTQTGLTDEDWYNVALNPGIVFEDAGIPGFKIGPIIKKDNNSITFMVEIPRVIKVPELTFVKNYTYISPNYVKIGSVMFNGISYLKGKVSIYKYYDFFPVPVEFNISPSLPPNEFFEGGYQKHDVFIDPTQIEDAIFAVIFIEWTNANGHYYKSVQIPIPK